MNSKKVLIFVIILLIGLNLISFSVFWQKQKEYNQLEQALARKITFVNFLNLFINKVLDPSFTMTIEDRVLLENTVKELKNEEIQLKWKDFTASPNEIEAQRLAFDILKIITENLEK